MSWMARSLSNSFISVHRSSRDGDHIADQATTAEPKALESGDRSGEVEGEGEGEDEDDPNRGVKEDLSEFSRAVARQFWGVASFLAPAPNSSAVEHERPSDAEAHREAERTEASDSAPLVGIRSDFSDISGKFRSGFSKLSANIGVSEISKIASNLLPFGAEEEEDDDEGNFGSGIIGITDEVMSFVHNISTHAETWLDFPLLSDDEDSDDFDMSDAQLEHAFMVERLSPRLAALRIELCPTHMSEGSFWRTYFVLLHPRLSKHDAELLSTPQVVEARALLLQKLQSQTKSGSPRLVDGSHRKLEETSLQVTTSKNSDEISVSESRRTVSLDNDKQPGLLTSDTEVVDKYVVEQESLKAPAEVNFDSNIPVDKLYEDEDDWLKDEMGEFAGSGGHTIPIDNDDVSFSDLEEEDALDVRKRRT